MFTPPGKPWPQLIAMMILASSVTGCGGSAPDEPGPPAACDLLQRLGAGVAPVVRSVALEEVFNASGMVSWTHQGMPAVMTVNDWRPEEVGRPWDPHLSGVPALTINDPGTGAILGNSLALDFVRGGREIEAITMASGALAALYASEDGAGIALPRRRQQLDLAAAWSKVGAHASADHEGLAFHGGKWFVLMTIHRSPEDHADRPWTSELYLASFHGDGRLVDVAGPVRDPDGTLHNDFGGDLTVLPDGNLIIPGFVRSGFVVVDQKARVLATVDLPTTRVEGVAWDAARCTMHMVRECLGQGWACSRHMAFAWISRGTAMARPRVLHSTGRSSGRSRSGGRCTVSTASRK